MQNSIILLLVVIIVIVIIVVYIHTENAVAKPAAARPTAAAPPPFMVLPPRARGSLGFLGNVTGFIGTLTRPIIIDNPRMPVLKRGVVAQSQMTIGRNPAAAGIFDLVPLPSGISNGDVIQCSADGFIYKVDRGYKRWYPSYRDYAVSGASPIMSVGCDVVNAIATGPDMITQIAPASYIYN